MRHIARAPAVVVLLALTLSLASCGSNDTGAEAEASTPAEPSSSSAVPSSSAAPSEPDATSGPSGEVAEVLAFEATDVNGDPFSGAELAGQDTMFWFWAPWCTVCARAADDVRAAAQARPDVTVIGVGGLSSDESAVQTFVDNHDLAGLRILPDLDGSLYTRFGISQQHSFAFVSADGEVATLNAYEDAVDLPTEMDEAFG